MKTTVDAARVAHTFVARQPIFDHLRRVCGYELLLHPAEEAARLDPSRAAARVIVDSALAIGLDALVGSKLAFVTLTRAMLVGGLASVLPRDRVVVQLGVDVEADDETLRCCREIVADGFALAIDDFGLTHGSEALVPLAKYLKVDFRFASTAASRQQVDAVRRSGGPQLIAKSVDTHADFGAAVAEGFPYLEGFFLGEPVVTPGQPIDIGAIGRLRVLHALHNPMLSVSQIEALIKPDAALCYQVLRTVNSAAFAQHRTIHSIQEALVLLGRDMIRRWISVWTLAGLGREVHPELIAMSSVRARFCELLGQAAGGPELAAEVFLVGLCSMLDAVLGIPMETVVGSVPLSDDCKAALSGANNTLRALLECAVAYERGDWPRAVAEAGRAGLDPLDLPVAHATALVWVRQLQAK